MANNDIIKFRFCKTKLINQTDIELFFDEHFEEIFHRLTYGFIIASISIIIFFFNLTPLLEFLKTPVQNIKFFQLSPGEYFISTIKVSFYIGITFTIPILLSQLILFLIPGLNNFEQSVIVILITCSLALFGLGLLFSFYILVPAALKFFLSYSNNVIEPLWSFNDYLEFVLTLLLSTGFIFQLPIFQVLLVVTNIINAEKMLNLWSYVIIGSVIIGAIITPSADPFTQLILAAALIALYTSGAFISKYLTNELNLSTNTN